MVRNSPSGRVQTLVVSIFGRTGEVVPEPGDYVASQIGNDSSVSGANVAEALDILKASIAGILIELPNQNAVIPVTNIFPSTPPTGLYAIDVYHQVTTASGTATSTARIAWTDEAGPTNFSSTMFMGQLGRSRNRQIVRANGLSNITYQVLISGNVLLSKYHLTVHASPLL